MHTQQNNQLELLIGGQKNRLIGASFTTNTMIGADSHRENRFGTSKREEMRGG